MICHRFFISIIFSVLLFESCKKDDSSTNSGNNPDKPQGITIHLNSNPQGANIDIDGGVTGKTTPYTITNLTPGTHRFRIYRNLDYAQLDTSLYLQNNDELTITAVIKPLWSYCMEGQSFCW